MFNSIQGTITEKQGETLRILTGGIEWDIAVPVTDTLRLPAAGEPGRVFTWLYHREDQMRLFGFIDEQRRATFLELNKEEGIGPRQALKIMSGSKQEDLERALDTEDVGRLEAVPGLGKKTAQKMILALKGKLARDPLSSPGPLVHGELVTALVDMGYDRKAASEAILKAVSELGAETGNADHEKVLFKRAIVLLSGV